MDPFGPDYTPKFKRFVFNGTATTVGTGWQVWYKSQARGCSMAQFYVVGAGAGGGSGVVGANSTAAGGGGGGSGGTTVINIPLEFLPDAVYMSIGAPKTAGGLNTIVAVVPNNLAASTLVLATGGTGGGNASGATAGTAGAGGGAATAALMPLGWSFQSLAITGVAGTAGGTTGAAPLNTIGTNGARNNGGSGGAGLGAAASVGNAGGAISISTDPQLFLTHTGGAGGSTATTPPENGKGGFDVTKLGHFWMPGTGGGSTHGSATTTGLVQASGGDGGIGSGGGGMGGALTGSTAGTLSKGGPGIVIITCY